MLDAYYLLLTTLLHISNLSIATSKEQTEIVKKLSLTVHPGEVHAIMGPNGSGKSTLVNTLAGHPAYDVTGGEVKLDEKDLLAMEAHERARAGLFLAFQYPKDIAGVSLQSFLFAAYKAQAVARGLEKIASPIKFSKLLKATMEELHMDPSFADRPLNQGFSGGEKKKAEVLQMKVLQPRLALLDETDSGLDVDALKVVAEGVQSMRSPEFSCIVVTHYSRILNYLTPDYVHIMKKGSIVESGGAELAEKVESEGYAK